MISSVLVGSPATASLFNCTENWLVTILVLKLILLYENNAYTNRGVLGATFRETSNAMFPKPPIHVDVTCMRSQQNGTDFEI
jgi:hypothetical protein